MTAETERLRALVGAVVAGGVKLAKSKQREIQEEMRERGKARIGALFEAVIGALASYEPGCGPPRPLGREHLERLAQILAGMLREYEGTKRKSGRRRHDHRLLVIDFLLRQLAAPRTAPKKLHADVASAWDTTDANVKKLVTENRRSALALLKEIGSEKAARAVYSATKFLQRYRNRS